MNFLIREKKKNEIRKEKAGIYKCSPVSAEVWLHKAAYLVLQTMTQECQFQSSKIGKQERKKRKTSPCGRTNTKRKLGKIPKSTFQ